MQASKLQLEQYFVDEASFRLKEGTLQKLKGEPGLEPDDMDIEVRLGEHEDDPLRTFCQLEVKLTKETARMYPYSFKVVMVGFFQLSPECTSDDKDVLMANTAPSMLYTAAREYLLTITGRTRYLPIMLPTVLFIPKQKKVARGGKAGAKQVVDSPATKSRTKRIANN